jgi:hypothetical protein
LCRVSGNRDGQARPILSAKIGELTSRVQRSADITVCGPRRRRERKRGSGDRKAWLIETGDVETGNRVRKR